MKELFVHIYRVLSRHRIIPISLYFLLLTVFALLASQLKFETDLNSMMPGNEDARKAQKIFTSNKMMEKVIVSVSARDTVEPEILTTYIDEFATLLQSKDKNGLISRIETKQDDERIFELLDVIHNNLPFLLREEDYRYLDSISSREAIDRKLEQNLQSLSAADGPAMKQLLLRDPLGISMPALKKLYTIKLDEGIQLYDGYISNTDNTQFTFFLYTTYPASNTAANEGLEKLVEETKIGLRNKEEFAAVESHVFGAQLVAAGNASQMRKDTYLTLGITLALLLGLFIYFFRNAAAPLQIMIPVVFGALFGMAMMYLLKGTVSMIALGASSVILGIAVNYSLHFMTHLRHAHSREETIRELTQPMTIGSFTTIAAFLSLTLVHTPVLQELGLFTAFNLVGSSLCTLIFLPHFIRFTKQKACTHANLIEQLASWQPNKNKWFVMGIALVTLLMAFYMNRVHFNEDMMKMNFMSDTLQRSQAIINERNSESLNSVFFVTEGRTFEEALEKNEKTLKKLESLKHQGFIKKYISPATFLPSTASQQEKLQRWNSFWQVERKERVLHDVQNAGDRLGYNSSAFDGLQAMLEKNYTSPDTSYQRVFRELFREQVVEENGQVQLISLIKTSQENRAALFESLQSNTDGMLIDKQQMASRFVEFIRDDFYKILFLTSFIVFFTILITYGRIEIALISFIPMVITWICILGLMALLGIEFNIINIIISTLIFGLGDDYSIFITDGLIEKYKYGTSKIQSVKTSILLSAITTIIGLGILVLAKHPALRSIAMVSVIGILSILFVSQTIQPLLFNFFIQNRAAKKQHPFTLWSFAKTIFAFFYYVTGCMLVTISGFILTRCIPFAKDKMKYVYHVIVSKMMWSLLYIMGNVKKRIENRELADFSKPSVIIANHSSFLDLLRIISMHPKILLMTNRWVWRSPVFGALVRMADYYPVEEGAEFSIDRLQYWVDRGYSIAVFPEGTRSYDDSIKRFHKGAFYIAEKMGLDIQPVLFHGIGYTMSKGDFLLKDGEVNMKYLPRISQHDKSFGEGYVERAKKIGRYFREQFLEYKAQREVPSYFKEQLIRNYQYKGPVLEWYCRIKSRLEKYYNPIEKLVPKEGQILDIGCGYGFLAYILSWTSDKRIVTGLDYDEEKIAVASYNFSKHDRIHFLSGDALSFPGDKKYDAILIMDVLHYLLPEKQKALLEKCETCLNNNGKLIVRDGWKDLEKKHKGTVLSEIFSTKLFNFNKTENELHFISHSLLKDFADAHRLHMEILDDTRFTSNIVCVFTKRETP